VTGGINTVGDLNDDSVLDFRLHFWYGSASESATISAIAAAERKGEDALRVLDAMAPLIPDAGLKLTGEAERSCATPSDKDVGVEGGRIASSRRF
jgi:hypothetical protein